MDAREGARLVVLCGFVLGAVALNCAGDDEAETNPPDPRPCGVRLERDGGAEWCPEGYIRYQSTNCGWVYSEPGDCYQGTCTLTCGNDSDCPAECPRCLGQHHCPSADWAVYATYCCK